MSELKLKGKIKQFLDVKEGVAKTSGNAWKKQSFIIANNEGYEGKEQVFCFEVFGEEKVENLTKFQKVGDEVVVSFNISTNEWEGKYFASLSAWRIEKAEAQEPKIDKAEPFVTDGKNEPDLPF